MLRLILLRSRQRIQNSQLLVEDQICGGLKAVVDVEELVVDKFLTQIIVSAIANRYICIIYSLYIMSRKRQKTEKNEAQAFWRNADRAK